MNFNRTSLLAGLLMAGLSLSLNAGKEGACPAENNREQNYWPLAVVQTRADETVASEQFLGPLFFSTQKADGLQAKGFRPFYLERKWTGETREVDILYPLFMRRTQAGRSTWSILHLINSHAVSPNGSSADPGQRGFDLWPLYFSRQTGNPATSYRAVFPLFGPVKNRLGNDRMDWVLFPLYGRFQSGGKVVYTTPWPFIRIIQGGGHRGWALWPLAGWREETGKSRSQYYLWPLIYRNETKLDQAKPSLSFGVLPFYSADHSAELTSEIFLWPFFGYTNRSAPKRYSEIRWLWPFLVQGRGEERFINRWAPFYTHSTVKGVDKTWVLWPLWRRQTWSETGLDHNKTQFLFFVYWSHRQRITGRPEAALAEKAHLWPLVSSWDNGAGRRQTQILSPLEVFFQDSEAMRLNWSPFFALYQFDQRAPGHRRTTLLWNAVSYERCDSRGESRFHLGPVVGFQRSPDSGRISLLGGLLGLQRGAGQTRWKPFLFRFKS